MIAAGSIVVPVNKPVDRQGEGSWTVKTAVSLVVMSVLLDLLAMSYMLMAIALPAISEHYKTTQGAWMPTAFMLVGAVASPLVGRLADMYGKRRYLLVCTAIAGIGAVIAALAPSFAVLLVGCALIGMLNPCVFLAYTLIPEVFPPRAVAMSASIVVSGMGLAAIPAPFIAGWLLATFGFHSIFWFLVVCLAVCLPVLRLSTGESSTGARTSLDWVGAGLLAAGLAGILVAVSFAPRWGWAASGTLTYLIGGVALLIAWIVSARWAREPLIDMSLLTNRAVSLIALSSGMAFAVSAVFVIVLPMMVMVPSQLGLGYGFGLSAIESGVILAPFGAACLVGGVICGVVVKRVGARMTMVVGMAVAGVGAVLMVLLHQSEGLVILFGVVVGLGTGAAYASGPALILELIPEAIRGIVGAITNVAQALLPAIFPVVAFAVLNSHIALHKSGEALYSNSGISLGLAVAVVAAALGVITAMALPSRVTRAGG